MIAELQDMVEASFPAFADANLIRGIAEGVALADQLRASDPILSGAVGRDLAGHLRRAGVIARIKALCDRGELPFEASIDLMPIGNWHHLVLRASDTLVSHLCRTESALAFPKDTPNRQDERLTNQPDLFDENVISLSAALKVVEEKCVWLTYGFTSEGDLTHACWAMPSPPNVAETWYAHINVVERLRRSGQAIKSPPKGVDPNEVLKFKRDIDEALRRTDSNRETEE
ncbi:MAG: hypothetical protein KDE63_06570 [Novosphingobium sp.]|nr:hypothetical protein [Novosphingobium sp.]